MITTGFSKLVSCEKRSARLVFSLLFAASSNFAYLKPVSAKDVSDIARIAKTITVRIEGATQGSGVLVERSDDTYTVLTAWHVLKSNRPGEEVSLFINGKQYFHLPSSIQRIGNVDLATIKFSSTNSYNVAKMADIGANAIGTNIFIGGFPLTTQSVTSRIFRFLEGRVIAYDPNVQLPNGYNFLTQQYIRE